MGSEVPAKHAPLPPPGLIDRAEYEERRKVLGRYYSPLDGGGQYLLAITARQYPSPNAQHHETPRIIQSVPPVESASSSEVVVAR